MHAWQCDLWLWWIRVFRQGADDLASNTDELRWPRRARLDLCLYSRPFLRLQEMTLKFTLITWHGEAMKRRLRLTQASEEGQDVRRAVRGQLGEVRLGRSKTYLATPPGTLHGSLVTKKLQRPSALHFTDSASRSKSSPIGQPQPASRTSCMANGVPSP
jgi:hypothetical protein